MARKRPYVEVDPNDLKVDDRYQRELSEPYVSKIVNEYDERLVNPAAVAQRNGSMWVVDGQHLVEAHKRLGLRTWVRIVDTDDASDEAHVYVGLNTKRRKNSSLEIFKAALFRGDPLAVGLNECVEAAGLMVGNTARSPNAVGAIGQLTRSFVRFGPTATTEGLALAERLWIGTKNGNRGDLLAGAIQFMAEYGDRVGEDEVELLDRKSARFILEAADREAEKVVSKRGGSVHYYAGKEGAELAVAKVLRRIAGVRGRPRTSPKQLDA